MGLASQSRGILRVGWDWGSAGAELGKLRPEGTGVSVPTADSGREAKATWAKTPARAPCRPQKERRKPSLPPRPPTPASASSVQLSIRP